MWGQCAQNFFLENAMRDLSTCTTLCQGVVMQVLASVPLQARLDGSVNLPGVAIPIDGLQ